MTTMNNVKKETEQETKKETRWVITKDGIRMTYEEYIEMVRSDWE